MLVHERPLTVALYPYFADTPWLESCLAARWDRTELRFITWDCYSEPPPPEADVFEYDPMFLPSFAAAKYCAALEADEVHDLDDLLEFALDGARWGGRLLAIPHYASTAVLFYRAGDAEIASARTLADLERIVGVARYDGCRPPPDEGLLVNFSAALTSTVLYLLRTRHRARQVATGGMVCGHPLQRLAVEDNRRLLAMAGRGQALASLAEGQRVRWFAEGSGRCYYDFCERVWYLPAAGSQSWAQELSVRLLPPDVSDHHSDVTGARWFVTMCSVRPGLEPRRRALAVKLANLYCGSALVLQGLFPHAPTTTAESGQHCQYQLPVRRSVLRCGLPARAPFYGPLLQVFRQPRIVARLPARCRSWWLQSQMQVQRAITHEHSDPVPVPKHRRHPT